MEEIRYPIGRFQYSGPSTAGGRADRIEELALGPELLSRAVDGLSDEQMDSCYREGGWKLRQVVHHVADSHLNGYLRLKWTLAEEQPVIKTYNQKDWAELADSRTLELQPSLAMLTGIHLRWVAVYRALQPPDFERFFIHPETRKEVTVDFMLALYAWHGKHHASQITTHRDRQGW